MAGRVLLVSELGAGAGHVAPLMRIGDALREDHGAETCLVLGDPILARRMFPGASCAMLPAPVGTAFGDATVHSTSYADLLAGIGFLHDWHLTSALKCWDDLYARLDPDFIVADHAPTAVLAARGRLPVCYVGNGFTLPPTTMPDFPALKRDADAPLFQPRMLSVLNAVLAARGQPALTSLPALFETELRGVFTLPQLDPYHRLRTEPVLGVYTRVAGPVPPPERRGLFLYSGAGAEQVNRIADAAARLDLPVEAYLGPQPGAAAEFLRGLGATVHAAPPDLAEVLARNSVIVTNGGSGVTQSAMVAGRPQLVLPTHVESELTGWILSRLDVGLAVMPDEMDELAGRMRTVAEVDSFARNAGALAAQIATAGLPEDPVGQLADRIARYA